MRFSKHSLVCSECPKFPQNYRNQSQTPKPTKVTVGLSRQVCPVTGADLLRGEALCRLRNTRAQPPVPSPSLAPRLPGHRRRIPAVPPPHSLPSYLLQDLGRQLSEEMLGFKQRAHKPLETVPRSSGNAQRPCGLLHFPLLGRDPEEEVTWKTRTRRDPAWKVVDGAVTLLGWRGHAHSDWEVGAGPLVTVTQTHEDRSQSNCVSRRPGHCLLLK